MSDLLDVLDCLRGRGVPHLLRSLGACAPATRWAESLPVGTSFQQAWDLCPRGEWLLWLLARPEMGAVWVSPEIFDIRDRHRKHDQAAWRAFFDSRAKLREEFPTSGLYDKRGIPAPIARREEYLRRLKALYAVRDEATRLNHASCADAIRHLIPTPPKDTP